MQALGGNTFALREPEGLVYRFRSDGRLDYVEDPNANRISASYTEGLLTRLTHAPSGQFLDIVYNAGKRIEHVMDSDGRVSLFDYDAANEHLLAVTSAGGLTTRYTYSTNDGAAREHALLSIEFPDGSHQFFAYDTSGRLSACFQDGDAEHWDLRYDTVGTVTVSDTLGATTKFYFDHRGLFSRSDDSECTRRFLDFDERLELSRVTYATGESFAMQYDRAGRLLRVTDPLGQDIDFSYGPLSRLTSMIDPGGNAISYGCDSRGNVVWVSYEDGSTERYEVNSAGDLLRWTNRRGQVIDYVVNARGQVVRKTLPDGSSVEYQYNARGKLERTIDALGTTQYEYLDPHNPDLVTAIRYPDGRFLEYTYENGRRVHMVDQDGFATAYGYDAAGLLQSVRDGSGTLLVQYHYDAAGRIAREDKGNGTYTLYGCDANGRLEHVANYRPDGTINTQFDYTLDELGRRVTMTTLEGDWSYHYDGLGRLTEAVFTSTDPLVVPDQDLQYEYDAAGNRTRAIVNGSVINYVSNDLNQYVRVGTAQLAYDLDGNLISRTENSVTTTYLYDAENRLVGVSSPGDAWSYVYDALGNRVATIHNGEQINYLVDPTGLGHVIAEYDSSGLVAHYTHAMGLVSRTDAAQQAFYDFDALGSTAGLSAPDGTYLNRYAYLPFGEHVTIDEAVANPFMYVGQEGVMHEGPGLDFMRARFYSPSDGRFVSSDPLGLAAGRANLYAYADQNPVNVTDPSGLQDCDADDEWKEVDFLPEFVARPFSFPVLPVPAALRLGRSVGSAHKMDPRFS